jgi:hypothetical protein
LLDFPYGRFWLFSDMADLTNEVRSWDGADVPLAQLEF